MNCPVCKSTELIAAELDENLTSLKLSGVRWKLDPRSGVLEGGSNSAALNSRNDRRIQTDSLVALAEPGLPIDCPGVPLPHGQVFPVGREVPRLYSGSLSGLQGYSGSTASEWEALKKRNLHDDLNSDVHFILAK